jgi:hypothetical protein
VAGPPAPVALAGRCLAANLVRCGRARVSGYTKSEGSVKLLVSSPDGGVVGWVWSRESWLGGDGGGW